MSISRRRFLETTALSSLAVPALHANAGSSNGIPMRTLGRTGAKVSILAFGCGSRLLAYKDEEKGITALNQGIDQGINYIDTAIAYGNGVSETWVGKVMKSRRKEVWLATKITTRDGAEALRHMDESLKRLQTGQVDLAHIHALMDDDDLAAIEAPDGLLKSMYRIRDQKLARYIGITCHAYPAVLKKALERHDFDCTQMALNAAHSGMVQPTADRPVEGSFESLALPVANRKNMGVIAMKIFGQDGLAGTAAPEKLLAYSWSLPVSACVVGMPQLGFLRENIASAKAFRPMNERDRRNLSTGVAGAKKASLDRYFVDHVDA